MAARCHRAEAMGRCSADDESPAMHEGATGCCGRVGRCGASVPAGAPATRRWAPFPAGPGPRFIDGPGSCAPSPVPRSRNARRAGGMRLRNGVGQAVGEGGGICGASLAYFDVDNVHFQKILN